MSEDHETKEQEEIKLAVIQNPWRIFFWEAFLFGLTLSLGMIAAFKMIRILKMEEITLQPVSFWQFLLYFLLATAFILAISFFGKKTEKGKGIIFKAIFILAIFWGGLLLFSLWLPDFFALILILFLIFVWLKKPSILIHDLAVILGIAGVGAVLGLRLTSWSVVLLLIILSIYDFIAVYKTKHMVKMAKEMMKTGTILALIVPRSIPDFKTDLKEVGVPARRLDGKFLILGGGDIAFPLLLCVSLLSEGFINSFIVAIFALIGLLVSFWLFISQKIRKPIPALPPIALFSIIGFLITLFV